MAIEDIVISFDGGTAAAESGKTYNNFTGLGSTGQFDSDLSGYDSGAGTGVAIASNFTLTASTNGRLQGVDTRTQEVNREGSYSQPFSGNSVLFTATFPSTVTSVDVEVFLCTAFTLQTDIDIDINGSTSNAFDSTNNTTGATVTLTGIAPDGSDQIVIDIINQSGNFIVHNGLRFFNIVDSTSGSITPQMMQYLN